MLVAHPTDDLASAAWIDLYEPTPDEIARVHEATGLRVPLADEISEIESSSRLGFEAGVYKLSTPLVVQHDDGELALASVGFVLSARVLLTVRFSQLRSFDSAHESCRAHDVRTPEEAFLRIFEIVIDRSADKLEQAGAECTDLSRTTFQGSRPSRDLQAVLRRVGIVADRVSCIRDGLLGLGRIAAFVTESVLECAPVVSAARMKAIRADIASLTEYESQLIGKVQFVLDATLGFISVEQNDIVKTLTIASVVGIPPVVVAGIYGMNFQHMPELSWKLGYPMALLLMLGSALLPLWWFKHRGWM